MSAYMVDRLHVAYLLDAAMSHKIVQGHSFSWYHDDQRHELYCGDYDRAGEVGQMLWDANRESIMARYPDTREDFSNAPGPCDETFEYGKHVCHYGPDVDPVQLIKACRCFGYQACEYEDWEHSEAKAFIDTLVIHACSVLPGYDDAEWGPPKPTHNLYAVRA